jgi:hypothetical protein
MHIFYRGPRENRPRGYATSKGWVKVREAPGKAENTPSIREKRTVFQKYWKS